MGKPRLLRLSTLTWLFLVCLTVPAAPAHAATVTLDPAASSIEFELGATLHTVEGSFDLTEGRVTVDPASGEASGRIVVDATSGDTGKEKRDRDMHEKVLESDRHPTIVFHPARVEGEVPTSGGGAVTLHGSLDIHGSRHPLAVPLDVTVDGDRVTATGSFTVPYVEWGMEDPSTFILRVDKEVEVTIEAVGRFER